jgi:hypothetical protein
MARKLVVALFLVVTVLAVTNDSHADGNWWWGGNPYGFNRMYRTDREIPYFAEHPPVYYSHIVPRSYGQSPYAYWPGPFTPMITPEPIYVPNPYVPGVEELPGEPVEPAAPKKRKSSLDKNAGVRTSGPLVILNPYVTEKSEVAANQD